MPGSAVCEIGDDADPTGWSGENSAFQTKSVADLCPYFNYGYHCHGGDYFFLSLGFSFPTGKWVIGIALSQRTQGWD